MREEKWPAETQIEFKSALGANRGAIHADCFFCFGGGSAWPHPNVQRPLIDAIHYMGVWSKIQLEVCSLQRPPK